MSNYLRIKYNDISNGPSVRTSIFLAGCPGVLWDKKQKKYKHCSGCFNSESWDFTKGQIIDDKVINDVLKSLSFDYMQGLSILGGEPLSERNQQIVAKLIESVRNCYGSTKDIWIWTGYIYTKNIFNKNRIPSTPWKNYILKNADVIVDGPFLKEKFNIDLMYRGSDNQRVIYLKRKKSECKKM